MSLSGLLIVVVIVLLLSGAGYGFRGGWQSTPYGGYGLGVVGLILIVVLVLLLLGEFPLGRYR